MYLLFDEVQRISGWENAVNSFRVDFDCDIHITGSNAYLLFGNTLVSEGLLEERRKKGRRKPVVYTIQSYIEALLEAYIFCEIKPFNIRGREYLQMLGKYYIVDMGLWNYLLGYRDGGGGHILENIIYFELLRQEHGVDIRKIDNQEVDLVAMKADEKNIFRLRRI